LVILLELYSKLSFPFLTAGQVTLSDKLHIIYKTHLVKESTL